MSDGFYGVNNVVITMKKLLQLKGESAVCLTTIENIEVLTERNSNSTQFSLMEPLQL